MVGAKIEWTGRSDWNPIRGCTRKSTGCINCYAEIMAARFSKPGMWGHGFAHMVGKDHRWTGKVELIRDRLTLPLDWKRVPGFVFPSSTSDIFHEALSDEDIDLIMAVMALTPHFTYQLLTKRTERMVEYFAYEYRYAMIEGAAQLIWHERTGEDPSMWLAVHDLPNVWFGTSVENQETADERLPLLANFNEGALRWVSFEPLIGRVDATPWLPSIGWAVVGGESGHGARDNDFLGNARSLRDQCAASGVPFFGKQNFGKGALPPDLQIRKFPG